jgi:hypothetical protein
MEQTTEQTHSLRLGYVGNGLAYHAIDENRHALCGGSQDHQGRDSSVSTLSNDFDPERVDCQRCRRSLGIHN